MQTGKVSGKDRASLVIVALMIFGVVHYWTSVSRLSHDLVSVVASHFRSSADETNNPMLLHAPEAPGVIPALSEWATSELGAPGMVSLLRHMGVNYVRVNESSHGIIDVVLANRTDDEFSYISKHPLKDMPVFNNMRLSREDALAAGLMGNDMCIPLAPPPAGVPVEEWMLSTASCHQDRNTKFVSRASFSHQVLPLDPGTKTWVAYQIVILGNHAIVYGDTDHAMTDRTSLWFKQSVFLHFKNGLVQMALMWRARQSLHLGQFLTNCSFVRICSDYEGDQYNETSNPLWNAGLKANGVGPMSFTQIKTLNDPYLVGGPEYPNMGGDQFERALQFGYEFCCEGEGGGPWNYMTPGMEKNVAYEFYAYTVLHPDFLKNNPRWFDDHQEWTERLREAGIWIPAGHVTLNDVDHWVQEGHKLYPYTLGNISQ